MNKAWLLVLKIKELLEIFMQINLSKKDVMWSYIGTFLSMGANFLMLPIVVYYLEPAMLGLWYVFVSIGAVATLFDFGFSVTFARNITYCWSGAEKLEKEKVVFSHSKVPNYKLMKQVIYTCKLIYGLISGIVLVLLISFGTLYINDISKTVLGYQHYVAWFMYSLAIFLNLYYGYYSSFLRGVGAVKDANINTVVARSVQIIVTVFLLVSGFGIVGVSVAYLVYGIVFRVLGRYKFERYHNIGKSLGGIAVIYNKDNLKTLFFIVWHNAWRDGVIAISNYFTDQISVIICASYMTLGETGAFSLGTQIATAISVISGTLYNAYQPQLQAAYANKDNNKVKETMSIIVTTYIVLFCCGTMFTIFIVNPLIQYIKPEVVLPNGILLAICFYQFILKFRNCYTSYFSCTNRILYLKSFIVSAMICLGLSVVFMGYLDLGMWGLVLAQIISQCVYNVWYWPCKAHRELGVSLCNLIKYGAIYLRNKIL